MNFLEHQIPKVENAEYFKGYKHLEEETKALFSELLAICENVTLSYAEKNKALREVNAILYGRLLHQRSSSTKTILE